MKHPYQKFAQVQMLMMGLTLILGAFALFKGESPLVFLTLVTLSLSFLFEALVEWKKGNTFTCGQQVVRAVIIIIFASYLYF